MQDQNPYAPPRVEVALLATIGFIAVAGIVGVLIDGPGAA